MRKLIIAGAILLVLLGLGGTALLNLNRFIEHNKASLLGLAERALGRRVTVGDVRVTLWGGLGVSLKDFSVADDPAFSTGDFLRAKSLQVDVRFLPLLWKELRIRRLILEKPAVTVIRDKGGTYNFASLGAMGERDGARVGRGGRQKHPGGVQPPPVPLLASRIEVSDGQLHYLDKGGGVDFRAGRLNASVENLGWGKTIAAKMAAAVLGSPERNLTMSGSLGPLQPLQPLASAPVRGDIELTSLNLGALGRETPVGALLPAGLIVEGPISLKAHLEGPVEKLALTGDADATASAIRWGDRFAKPKGTPLHLSASGWATERALTFRTAKLQVHTLQLTGSGEIGLGRPPSLRLVMDAGRTALAGWDGILPPLRGSALSGTMALHARIQGPIGQGRAPQISGTLDLADVRAALSSLPGSVTDLNARLVFAGDRVDVPGARLRVGSSPVRVAAQVQRWAPLALTYRLDSPEVRLADLRAGGLGGRKPDVLREVKGEGRVGATNGAVTGQGRFSSARGTLADIDYTNLQATISLAGQVLGVENLSLRALDGTAQGSGRYDPRGASPRFSFASRTQGVDVGQFLRAVFPAAPQNLRGKANLDLRLAGNGRQWQDIWRALEGQGQAEILGGALADVNIAEKVLSGITGVPGLSGLIPPRLRDKYPEIFMTQDTRFNQLKGSAAVGGGRLRSDDLVIAATDYTARVRGWLGLDGSADARGVLSLSHRLSDDIATGVKEARYLLNDQGNLEVPFLLAGAFPRVRAEPDLAYVARRLLERGILRRGEEALEKQKPQDLLEKGLRRLFGK